MCWGFCKQTSEAEDIYQEVLLRIWKGLDGFKGKAKLSTWIYRITMNTCLYWQKKQKRTRSWEPVNQLNISTPIKNAEEQLLYDEKMEQLKKAIQLLKESDRAVALLLLEGLSYQEIAEVMGLTVNNVGVKISRIKTRIKKIMESILV